MAAARGKSMNAYNNNTRRHVANRSRGPEHHGYLENFVENVIITAPQELAQMHAHGKGPSTMNRTMHGNFTKKSVFKDPNQLIFTNSG